MNDKRFNFTKRAIESIIPSSEGKMVYYYDTNVKGLTLLITPKGIKTFYVYKKIKGRPERIKIGRFPDLTVEQARNDARVVIADIARRKNPAAERRAIRAEMTLKELFDIFMEKHAMLIKRTWKSDLNTYNVHLSSWGDKKVSEIRMSMVQDLLNEI